MTPELYQGPGHSPLAREVHRRASGRLRFVVVQESDDSWWLHVQPAPSLTSMSRRFRESHALRLLGFVPITATRFFPSACTFGGCYSRQIVLPDGGDVSDEVAGQLAKALEPAVDSLMQTAFELEPVGIDFVSD
jgi:hypothetical protein